MDVEPVGKNLINQLSSNLALLQWAIAESKLKGMNSLLVGDATCGTTIARLLGDVRENIDDLVGPLNRYNKAVHVQNPPTGSLHEPRSRTRKAFSLLSIKRWLSRRPWKKDRGADAQRTTVRTTTLQGSDVSGGHDGVHSLDPRGGERTEGSGIPVSVVGHVRNA